MVGEKRHPFDKSFVRRKSQTLLGICQPRRLPPKGLPKGKFMLTQKFLKECLTYDPLTGVFTWLERPLSHFKTDHDSKVWNTRYSGKPAGCEYTPKNSRTNYLAIRIKMLHQTGKSYPAHRLVWLYVDGKFPKNQIDHIDGNGLNNKLENLRDVTIRQNLMNTKTYRNNTSGIKGVSWNKQRGKFQAHIHINGKKKHLGCYFTLEDAAAARKAEELKHGYTTPEAQ